jgi:hypothetical protein
MTKRAKKNSREGEKNWADRVDQLRNAAADLFYISETDAAIEVVGFESSESDVVKAVLKKYFAEDTVPVETVEPSTFFSKLTAVRDWHGPQEHDRVERFRQISSLMATLDDATVIRVGNIQIDIFVVGRSGPSEYLGIRTKAVET